MSSGNRQRYWRSWEEGPGSSELVQITLDEFPEPLDRPAEQFSRRSFLKAAGFTAAVAAVGAGCSRAPVEKAIPYLIQPEEIVPGVSYFYATTCGGCSAACGVLAKNRDGRPIKLEGNREHPISRGGLCAVGQASLLELYDSQRLTGPRVEGKPASWEEADRQIVGRLEGIRSAAGAVRFLSGTISSPTLNAEIQKFLGQFRDARHVVYDALSSSAILDAHERTYGQRILPHYRFDKAEVIVSFDADFLGTWISPVEFTRDYAAGRRLDTRPPRMSYHVQFESLLSVTGAKADRRIRVSPQELGETIVQLASLLAQLAGKAFPFSVSGAKGHDSRLEEIAHKLWQARGHSLIVCGSQDIRLQVLTNFMNDLLGNYGSSLELQHPSNQKAGRDRDLQALLEELQSGKVAALFLFGVNPVYDLPNGSDLAERIRKVPLVVSLAERLDETSAIAHFVCPDHHSLESWGDAEPVRGTVSLFQPTIHPLRNTRAILESLATWRGQAKAAYDILRDSWRENVYARAENAGDFQSFWDRSVEAGFAVVSVPPSKSVPFRRTALEELPKPVSVSGDFTLVLYPKVGILDGRHAGNPWLQELPDPISKVTWDNYACVSPAVAEKLELKEGDVVRLEVRAEKGSLQALELPVFIQPGQHDRVIAVALGYGGKGTERFSDIAPKWIFARPGVGADGRIGKNAAPMLVLAGGNLQYVRDGVRLVKAGKRYLLASTQTHHSLSLPQEVPLLRGKHREIVRETTLSSLSADTKNPSAESAKPNGLWPTDHPYNGHRWAMAVDLTACTGCSGCVVACQAENNIPVVGKDEVLRHREMHWIRIDRYYSGNEDVEVVHQPMVCQQCDNAPCETVCPVVATVHSAEGLNQQIYNRCVGTRYCANNCPYKTRRFNWFNYFREDHLQNLALNPDVTVRSRGVMEKCSFCMQRIEAARMESRRQGKPIADGQIQTACQQSCPAQAIVFGDLNDRNSRVAKLARDPRRFGVLEEFNFRPGVNYLAVVRNRDSAEEISGESQKNG